jgi:SAM-dependent methyltransferase
LIYEAFDGVAADYDDREAGNPIMQLMRARSLDILETTFPRGANVLDVGCGTGTEALWLAERGRKVFAVDSSPLMLEAMSLRAAAAGLEVSSRLLRAGDLLSLAADHGEASFDGAYSSFGALNTEPALAPAVTALSRLVRPGGRIVLGIMNRWCVTEMALMVASGRFRETFRRARPSLRVPVGTNFVDVRYPSWRQVRRALQDRFRVISLQALPLLLVPYAWPALAAHPRIYSATSRLDAALSPLPPFAWLGDHLLVVAERADTGPSARLPYGG